MEHLNYLQVNYINAHATSTLAGDLAEVNAIKQVFKDPSGIKINATKVFQLINIISDIYSLPLPDG
jgi:3-oxoacyl-(acyl-carrier-protein) synthase